MGVESGLTLPVNSIGRSMILNEFRDFIKF